jgi:3-hexulose-6-phosphate synthase
MNVQMMVYLAHKRDNNYIVQRKSMKFQISFDSLDIEHNLQIAEQVAEYADVLEIGSLPLFKHGITVVEAFRERFPEKVIFADTKIIDRGRDVASLYSQAGADWISVMAGTSREVVHGACSKAHDLGKKVMLDLIDAGSPGQEALEAKSLGVDALLFHQSYDEGESLSFLEKWEMVRGNSDLPIFISAKINRDTINQILEIKPDGIVIGKAICESNDPTAEAQFFYDKIKK